MCLSFAFFFSFSIPISHIPCIRMFGFKIVYFWRDEGSWFVGGGESGGFSGKVYYI